MFRHGSRPAPTSLLQANAPAPPSPARMLRARNAYRASSFVTRSPPEVWATANGVISFAIRTDARITCVRDGRILRWGIWGKPPVARRRMPARMAFHAPLERIFHSMAARRIPVRIGPRDLKVPALTARVYGRPDLGRTARFRRLPTA